MIKSEKHNFEKNKALNQCHLSLLSIITVYIVTLFTLLHDFAMILIQNPFFISNAKYYKTYTDNANYLLMTFPL